MRLVLDTSAAANIVLQTKLAPALMVILEQADRVIAPSQMHSAAQRPMEGGPLFRPDHHPSHEPLRRRYRPGR